MNEKIIIEMDSQIISIEFLISFLTIYYLRNFPISAHNVIIYRNNLAAHLNYYFFIHKQVLGGFALFIFMFRK